MRTVILGDGEPELAVLGGVHGDEPCGVNAIEAVLDEEPAVQRPVKFVVANEEALAAEQRYLEADLNRAFPGDADGETHESRLAAELEAELADCTTLSMHSTQSYGGRFALINETDDELRQILSQLTVDAVVDVGVHSRGRLFERVPHTIEVECGFQGSTAATEHATDLVWEFLGATGAVPAEEKPAEDVPLFKLNRQIPKREGSSYQVYASNFERVAEGEAFAAADGEDVIAEEAFYPVLLSAYGYESVFGYTAERLGTVSGAELQRKSV